MQKDMAMCSCGMSFARLLDDDGFYAFCVDEPEMSKLLLKTQIDLTIASVLQTTLIRTH